MRDKIAGRCLPGQVRTDRWASVAVDNPAMASAAYRAPDPGFDGRLGGREMVAGGQRGLGKLRALVSLLLVVALVAGSFWATFKGSYASGQRAWVVQKVAGDRRDRK